MPRRLADYRVVLKVAAWCSGHERGLVSAVQSALARGGFSIGDVEVVAVRELDPEPALVRAPTFAGRRPSGSAGGEKSGKD